MKIRTALISSHTKDARVSDLARALRAQGVKVYASGGTCTFLAECWMDVTPLENLTGFSDLLGGRVKTLHPKIFAGILAKDIDRREPYFDLVAVDLYPFEKVEGDDVLKLIEMIDIGGVALLRAAAKNFAHVLPIAGVDTFPRITELVEQSKGEGHVEIDDSVVKEEAIRTFRYTAHYDSVISTRLADVLDSGDDLPEYQAIPMHRTIPLRYGENPHQNAALYGDFQMEKLHGKELSYNNLLDTDGTLFALSHFTEMPTCVIVKHLGPCGIGTADNLKAAYTKALASDPQSAFGGIVGCSVPVDGGTAELMHSHFFEVVLAPDFTEEALSILTQKKNIRLLRIPTIGSYDKTMWRSIAGGTLICTTDAPSDMPLSSIPTDRKPTDAEIADLRFAWQAVRCIKSNAIVIAKDNATMGIGGGLPSRVDAARLAVFKAGESAKGAVAASDAFLPFPDTLEVLAEAGVTALVQPGGSRGDQAVIDSANRLGIAMVFTGQRVFRH